MKGWVYIITNKAMPNLVKVGFSTKDPELEVAELNSVDNPYPYIIEYDVLLHEPQNVAHEAHNLLKSYHENKDWFHCTVDIALNVVRKAATDFMIVENCRFETQSKKSENSPQRIGKFVLQEGIATDTQTGLTWLRFAHGQLWKMGKIENATKSVDWETAIEIATTFNAQGGYAGHTDWRLPSIDELKTLIDKIRGKQGNYIDTEVFPQNYRWFWSATAYSRSETDAWIVYFYNGTEGYDFKKNHYAVRLVRGETLIIPPKFKATPAPNVVISETKVIDNSLKILAQSAFTQERIGRFIVQGCLANDTQTGLMWCRFAYGQRWENETTVGDVKKVDWDTAFEVVKQFNLEGGAGYEDWRLPTIDELKTLVDKIKGKSGNYIDEDVFPQNQVLFWSSTPYATYSPNVRIMDFNYGYGSYVNKYGNSALRFVRGHLKN